MARFELVEAYPALGAVADANTRHHWSDLATAVRALDPAGQALATRLILAGRDATRFLERVHDHLPHDPLALALLGRTRLAKSPLTRSPLFGRSVTQARLTGGTTGAELLAEAIRLDPDLAVARQGWVEAARPLGLAESRDRYEAAAALAPHELDLQLTFLVTLSPAWGGSTAAMLDFARTASAAAPDGSPAAAVIAAAHVHRMADSGVSSLRDPAVLAELEAAGERGVGAGFGWVEAASWFAMAFTFAAALPQAARWFETMGDLGSEAGWELLQGDARRSFTSYRKQVLARR